MATARSRPRLPRAARAGTLLVAAAALCSLGSAPPPAAPPSLATRTVFRSAGRRPRCLNPAPRGFVYVPVPGPRDPGHRVAVIDLGKGTQEPIPLAPPPELELVQWSAMGWRGHFADFAEQQRDLMVRNVARIPGGFVLAQPHGGLATRMSWSGKHMPDGVPEPKGEGQTTWFENPDPARLAAFAIAPVPGEEGLGYVVAWETRGERRRDAQERRVLLAPCTPRGTGARSPSRCGRSRATSTRWCRTAGGCSAWPGRGRTGGASTRSRSRHRLPPPARNRRAPMTRPVFVRSPKLGVLNLLGAEGNALLAEDLPAVAPLFGRPVAPAPGAPVAACDVLLVYCALDRNGALAGSSEKLLELLKASRARVAVLASRNAGDAYFAATKGAEAAGLNLVLTTDRRGARFAPFLRTLFSEMFLGTPMPVAWAKLAPQGDPRAECPAANFVASGSIAFQ